MKYELVPVPLDVAKQMAEFQTTQDIVDFLVDEYDWTVITENTGSGFQEISSPEGSNNGTVRVPAAEFAGDEGSSYWDVVADIAIATMRRNQ